MKSIYSISIFLLMCLPIQHVSAGDGPGGKTFLTGIVTDKATGETLPGVDVFLPDLKTGAVTDLSGHYRIDNLPLTKVLVQVRYTGYKMIAVVINLQTTTTMDFAMEESVNELNEIVVTGLSGSAEKNKTPTPITTIPVTQLLERASTNAIDALTSQPGISQISTGVGISKPVIRGLGYNRVVTVVDGIRQEGQQWGDEHGIEVDEFGINKIEILKGPASLLYGSDAMAGVINFLPAPPLPEGQIHGNVLANYQSNNGLYRFGVNLSGNQKGLIWDARYSSTAAHAYQNKYDGYVFNSGFRENALGGIVGLNKSWGYSHLHFSWYHMVPGIVEGERDSATGQFVKPFALNDSIATTILATDEDYKSYRPQTPYQDVNHIKLALNNSFILGQGTLKATLGWQQNQRQEYADILNVGQYGLYFLLNTFNYDLRYIRQLQGDLELSIGINGMEQSSDNRGSEFLVPAYTLFDIGGYIVASKSLGKLDLSGGVRYDTRDQQGQSLYLDANGQPVDPSDPGAIEQFSTFHSTFSGVSGSVGATYQWSDTWFSKFNISRGYRAPNIAELASNGVHEGTLRYEIGDPDLNPETSLQFDLGIGHNADHVTAELDLFHNQINDYIFSRKIEAGGGGDSIIDGYSVFKFVSGDARLAGGEISFDVHPHPFDWMHLVGSFAYVQAIQNDQPDSSKYLPLIPGPKMGLELKANAKSIGKLFSNAFAKLELEQYFEQNKFYAAYGTETATPAYTLLHFGLGTEVHVEGLPGFSVYFNVNNLMDIAYQSHLSRLKYGETNLVTGRTGVYNMGRNFSIKILVPLQF